MDSRRTFLSTAGFLALTATFGNLFKNNTLVKPKKDIFIHHVYFYLNNPASQEDQAKLVEGLNKLSKISYFKLCHIGVPADTHRDVVARDYQISWLVFFKNKEDQEKYQSDPTHLKFVEEYKHLWKKVVVYDSVDV